MTRLRLSHLIPLACALLAPPVQAQVHVGGSLASAANDDPSSTEGALFLLLPVGAQAVALGRAMTAVSGSESAFWNPAGLAGVDGTRLVLFRGDHFAGTATAASFLMPKPGLGTLGISYFLLDAGELEQRDENGNYTGNISIRNHLGIASFATRLWGRVNVGVNLKVVQFRLSCRGICADAGTTATTYAMDWGIQVDPSKDLPLRFGAMVAHVGPRLQVLNAEQADPLPSRARIALGYDFLRGFAGSRELGGWLLVELQDRLRDPGSPSLYLASELTAGQDDALFLRAGYVVGDLDQENGARVGLGLRYERFELAIAKSLVIQSLTGESEPVHVTFAIVF